jgi:hypothetical protein
VVRTSIATVTVSVCSPSLAVKSKYQSPTSSASGVQRNTPAPSGRRAIDAAAWIPSSSAKNPYCTVSPSGSSARRSITSSVPTAAS